METKHFNNETELRIQELYEESKGIYSRGANTQLFSGILIGLVFGVGLYYFEFQPPMMMVKWIAIAVVILAVLAGTWFTVVGYKRLSKTESADEMLHLHGKIKKQTLVIEIVLILILIAACLTLNYTGAFDQEYLYRVSGTVIFWTVAMVFLIVLGLRDCKEIREMKKLMQEKPKSSEIL